MSRADSADVRPRSLTKHGCALGQRWVLADKGEGLALLQGSDHCSLQTEMTHAWHACMLAKRGASRVHVREHGYSAGACSSKSAPQHAGPCGAPAKPPSLCPTPLPQVEWLRGSHLHTLATDIWQAAEASWEELAPLVPSGGPFTRQALQWAFGVLLTRLVRLPGLDDEEALVPWADFANHDCAAATYLNWEPPSSAVVLRADRRYGVGDQVRGRGGEAWRCLAGPGLSAGPALLVGAHASSHALARALGVR